MSSIDMTVTIPSPSRLASVIPAAPQGSSPASSRSWSSLSTSRRLYRTVPAVQFERNRGRGDTMPTASVGGGGPAKAVPGAGWALALLLAINLFNYIDRQIL